MIDAGQATGIGIFIFRGEYSGGDLVQSHEGQLEWIKLDQLKDYPLVEDLQIILPRLMELKRGDPPKYLRYFYDDQDRLQVRFG